MSLFYPVGFAKDSSSVMIGFDYFKVLKLLENENELSIFYFIVAAVVVATIFEGVDSA